MAENLEIIKILAILVFFVVLVLRAKSIDARGDSHSFDVRFRSK